LRAVCTKKSRCAGAALRVMNPRSGSAPRRTLATSAGDVLAASLPEYGAASTSFWICMPIGAIT
jgi:hypothetical protein